MLNSILDGTDIERIPMQVVLAAFKTKTLRSMWRDQYRSWWIESLKADSDCNNFLKGIAAIEEELQRRGARRMTIPRKIFVD
jgi:hypothetical protein